MANPVRIPIAATAVLLAAWSIFWLWSTMEAERKLEPLGLARDSETVNVVVTLAFAPEAFHFGRAQNVGHLVKTDGNKMHIRNADPKHLANLARAYWVLEVEPWNE